MPTYGTPVNGVAFSEAYAEAIATARIDRIMLPTYEIGYYGDEWDGAFAVRIVNDHTDLLATLEGSAPWNAGEEVLFVSMPVEVSGPDESDSSQTPSIMIAIDGVSSLLVEQLDRAISNLVPVTITERIYASDDTTAPAVLPVLVMTLRDVKVTDTRVTARAVFYDPSNRGFPREEYTQAAYPGLTAR